MLYLFKNCLRTSYILISFDYRKVFILKCHPLQMFSWGVRGNQFQFSRSRSPTNWFLHFCTQNHAGNSSNASTSVTTLCHEVGQQKNSSIPFQTGSCAVWALHSLTLAALLYKPHEKSALKNTILTLKIHFQCKYSFIRCFQLPGAININLQKSFYWKPFSISNKVIMYWFLFPLSSAVSLIGLS